MLEFAPLLRLIFRKYVRPTLEYLGLSFYRFERPLLSGKQVLTVSSSYEGPGQNRTSR
jgi:hypothetical protein